MTEERNIHWMYFFAGCVVPIILSRMSLFEGIYNSLGQLWFSVFVGILMPLAVKGLGKLDDWIKRLRA